MNYSDIFRALVRSYAGISYHLLNGYALPATHICFELTYRCNLSCEMCQFFQFADSKPAGDKIKDELSFEEVISLVEQFPPYALITFTGGELFLRKDTMKILEYASRRRRITVVSNGTYIDQELAERLVGLATDSIIGKGLFLVEISLEGRESVHESISNVKGSFAKTVSALKNLVAARRKTGRKYPLFNIKSVITPANAGELSAIYGIAREIGVDMFNPMIHSRLEVTPDKLHGERQFSINTSPPPPLEMDIDLLERQLEIIFRDRKEKNGPQIRFSPLGITREEAVKYYKGELDMGRYSCRPPWYLAGISPYGDVTVCPYFSQGNVRSNSFKKIWNDVDMVKLRRAIKNKERFPGCFGCCNMTFMDG